MDSPLKQQPMRLSSIIVRDKLPQPLPLLPKKMMLSQKPRPLMQIEKIDESMEFKETEPYALASGHQSLRDPILISQFTQLLKDQSKVAFNIMGSDEQSLTNRTFGFQYIDKEQQTFKAFHRPNEGSSCRLSFQSRFQGGNLLLAYEYSPTHYLLIIRPDYNTLNYCQWFYFETRNETSADINVTFSILNMTKANSLFKRGMKVMALKDGSTEWERVGQNISYLSNQFVRYNGKRYHTLSWTVNFSCSQPVRFAYSQPYTYSQLNRCLDRIEGGPCIKRTILCRTLLNNRVDLLTVSSGSLENKKIIVIVSRAHPAESVSSYVMKGLLEFILSDKAQAKMLREKFVFKLVPMLNPDGVIIGNSRCTINGLDINRCWTKPNRKENPQVYHLKKMVMMYGRSDRLAMFCDLHGHSKKKNIFAYGCHDRMQPYASRELPYILSKLTHNFSFKDCNFQLGSCKQGTARVSLWKKLRIPNIFTFQSSFCSAEDSHYHLDERGYKQMGEYICKAINIYFSDRASPFDDSSTQQLLSQLKSTMIRELHRDRKLVNCGMEDTSGSESEEETDEIYREVLMNKQIVQKPKIIERKIEEKKDLATFAYRRINENNSPYGREIKKHQKLESSDNLLIIRRRVQKHGLSAFKIQSDLFSVTENVRNEDLARRSQQKLNYRSLRKKATTQTQPLIKDQTREEKFVPQFTNFNFQQKFSRTTLQQQFRSKLSKKTRDDQLLAQQTLLKSQSNKNTAKQAVEGKMFQFNMKSSRKPKPAGMVLQSLVRRAYKIKDDT